MLDHLIYNAVLVTVNADFEIIDNGYIGIEKGRISCIGKGKDDADLPDARNRTDAKGGIVMPGLVNTHTHLPMTLFRGLADDLPLMTWLNDHIFPAEAAHINPESVYWSTLLACAEMILSGTTTCCDGYFHEDYVAEAVDAAGLRAVLGQGVIDFPAPGVPDPAKNIRTAQAFLQKWKEKSPLITPSIFCHSPYTCSEETLKAAKSAAGDHLFQIHAAETVQEREKILADHGMTPVAYLEKAGVLDRQTLLVHGVWIDPEEDDILVRCGATISHNPASNMKLSSGVSPVPRFQKRGIKVGLGTDGPASSNTLDLFRAMDLAAKLQKVHLLDPTAADAESIIRMATIEGAEAIGLGQLTGSLEPGKQADIILLDMEKPHLQPLYSPASHIVYAARGADVTHVMVVGRFLLRDRILLTLEPDEIFRKMEKLAGSVRRH